MLILFVVVGSNVLIVLLLFLPQILRSGGMLALDDLDPLSLLIASLIPFRFAVWVDVGYVARLDPQPSFFDPDHAGAEIQLEAFLSGCINLGLPDCNDQLWLKRCSIRDATGSTST